MPIYKKVDKDFFKHWSHEMAYILGLFAADGYITINNRGGQFWNIQIIDKKLVETIKKTVGAEHKIGIRKRAAHESLIYRLQIGSKEMCGDLRTLGFDKRKTKNLAIPYVPKKYFSDFVRGYFDGDGNVWVGYIHRERRTKLLALRVVFTSCSIDFLKKLRDRLEKHGVYRGVLRKERGNYYRLIYSIHGSLKLFDFMYNHQESSKSDLFLQRKKRTFEDYIKMRL